MVAPPGERFARFSRGAWAAMGQRAAGTWSWPRAVASLAGGLAIGALVFYLLDGSIAGYAGLVTAYLLMLYRARHLHSRYLERERGP